MALHRFGEIRPATALMAMPTARSILVVDDDPAMLLLAERIIKEKAPACSLQKMDQARHAIDYLQKQPVGVILCDHRLERADGLDVLAAALKHQPQAVRILMSGFPMPALLDEARRRAKIDDLIEKPIRYDALESVLTERVVRPYLTQ